MNKQQEVEINEAREQIAQLVAQNAANVAAKKKTEADVLVLKNELEETVGELNASDERMKHASMDVARLAEELAQEHERSQNLEKSKKALDLVVKELQAKLDDSEVALLKGEQKTICKFEQRLKTVQSQLNDEQRRSQENMKTLTRQNRQIRELQFEVAEDKSNAARLNELIEKLQSKIKIQKKQIEEAEEVANVNLQKYKQLQVALEHAEERAQNAENSLLHLRSKNRMTTSLSREKSEVMINGES
ncbi:hypothetical protein AB6A40_004981 [Gnathostoma spinigerum]|uniref:Paramyosin n=1 Tax=Gnathostoma spinigerum TaxID=75299 RepID=A0ABD6ENM1_9BILA